MPLRIQHVASEIAPLALPLAAVEWLYEHKHLKPHPAVFELSVRAAGVPAEQCLVMGNKESNDIEPALAMGMRAILVHPDDPPPTSTRAEAVAPDLWACAKVLKAMLLES